MTDLTNYFQGIGLTISNMTVTGSPNSYGFYSGTSNMAFGSGIIMREVVWTQLLIIQLQFLSTKIIVLRAI